MDWAIPLNVVRLPDVEPLHAVVGRDYSWFQSGDGAIWYDYNYWLDHAVPSGHRLEEVRLMDGDGKIFGVYARAVPQPPATGPEGTG